MTAIAAILIPFVLLSVGWFTETIPIPPRAMLAAVALSGVGAVILYLMKRKQYAPAVGIGAAWVGLMLACLMTWPGQIIAEDYSARSLGIWLRSHEQLPPKVLIYRDHTQSAVFYLTSEQRSRLRRGQMRRVRRNDVIQWHDLPSQAVVAIPQDELESVRLPATITRHSYNETVGRFHMFQPAGGFWITSTHEGGIR